MTDMSPGHTGSTNILSDPWYGPVPKPTGKDTGDMVMALTGIGMLINLKCGHEAP